MQDKETFMDKEIKRVTSFIENREIIRRRRMACFVDMVKDSWKINVDVYSMFINTQMLSASYVKVAGSFPVVRGIAAKRPKFVNDVWAHSGEGILSLRRKREDIRRREVKIMLSLIWG